MITSNFSNSASDSFIEPSEVPEIPYEISIVDAIGHIIPKGFIDLVDTKSTFDGVILNFRSAEESNKDISIPASIFSPMTHGVTFPSFILQVSTFSKSKLDYSNYPGLILNQNQLLWLTLHHRFTQFSANRIPYTHLLRDDISRLNNYGEYNSHSTHNAKVKSENSFAIISPWSRADNKDNLIIENPIGEYVKPITFSSAELHCIFRDFDVQASSESMASETSKFVIHDQSDKDFYKCAGYAVSGLEDNRKIKSIFPSKSNLPARLKTHVVSDAYMIKNASKAIFTEDAVDEDNNSDGTLINALVLFEKIDDELRFACGEIEASKEFASVEVYKDEIIRNKFSILAVKEGQKLKPVRNKFLIGLNQDAEEVSLYNFKTVDIVKIFEIGISGAYKVVAHCSRNMGSARVFSHTGLKGVTKIIPTLGSVNVVDASGTLTNINVDIITGPNSIKAKKNTILLAQAALAHQLGYSDKKTIDSMNEEEINSLVSKLPEVTYVDKEGNTKIATVGIIPVCVSELAYMFNNIKPQSFMSESGRYLKHGNHETLFNELWKQGVDEAKVEIVKELQMIICDNIGYGAIEETLPVYTPMQVQQNDIFTSSDIKSNMNPLIQYSSLILDEEYNKGWYLDLRYRDGGLTRMPSAKLINYFVTTLPNGSYIYPRIFQNVCNIINICIKRDEKTGRFNTGFLNDKKKPRDPNAFREESTKSLISYYITTVRGMLHNRLNLAQNLSKPKVIGVGMKQMTDAKVPLGTIVMLDDYAYKKLAANTPEYFKANGYFRALCVRNPVIWKSQIQSAIVWDRELWSDYLRIAHNIDINEYLSVKHCKELLFMHPEDAILQQSDVDGDLMPVFVPASTEAQNELDRFRQIHSSDFSGVDGIVQKEIDWINEYGADELSNNDIMDIEGQKYELYETAFHKNENANSFEDYFIDAIIAKGDVGIATFNLWALQCLLEIFKTKCDLGVVNDVNGKPMSFSDNDSATISYFYSRLVQDFVIRGIKWNEGGSSGFYPFLLSNIIKSENREMAYRFLNKDVKIEKEILDKFFIMISWAEDIDLLKTTMQFLTLYNSGKIPKGDMSKINTDLILETYYGKLVRPLYDIRNKSNEVRASGFVFSNDLYGKDATETPNGVLATESLLLNALEAGSQEGTRLIG